MGRTPVAKAVIWQATDAEVRKRGDQTGLAYTAFFQGGLTYESGKLAIMAAADAVLGG